MNAIEAAVTPLKNEAIARAEQEANALIARLVERITAHEWNVDAVAPSPGPYENRENYLRRQRNRDMYTRMFKSVHSTRRTNEPLIVERSPTAEALFIETAIRDAADQYDAFVAKLVGKIGDCDSATLTGNHVWGYSILTVTKGDTSERWKTQQIVNVSKHGKLFNQFPSRKTK